MEERCVLAVDSGGTKCDALLARADGTMLNWCHVNWSDAASGRHTFGSGRSLTTIAHAIRQAIGDVTCRELHVAGVSHLLHFVLDICAPHAAVIKAYRMHESDPAYTLCGADHGIVAIAGTGATIHAKTRDGRFLRLDGLGPYLGDYGGGFYIGSQAVRAVGKFDWHPRYHTSLVEPVFAALGLGDRPPSSGRLLMYMVQPRDRAIIASLARIVDEHARAGDAVAIRILHDAAAAMAETITCIAEQGGMIDEPYPLIGSGSIAQRSAIFWAHLCARVRAYAPNLQPMLPALPPVAGAALIALRRIGASAPAAVSETLRATAAPWLAPR